MVKCNACGGTYETTLPDGTRYFHTCPPLSVAELVDGLQKKTLTIPAADQQRYDAATKLVDANDTAANAADRGRRVLETITIERPGKRDENIAGVGAPGQPAPQKAPGTGVTKM